MNKKEPYHLLNLVKLLSIVSIIFFHINEFFFYKDINKAFSETVFLKWIELFSRLIPFSGQTIVFCIFFIWGLKNKKVKNIFIFSAFLLLAHLVISIPWLEGNFLTDIEWDIYPFILFSYFVVQFLNKWPTLKRYFVLISLLMLWIPTRIFSSLNFPFFLKGAFVGNCMEDFSGAWPLLPWVFLPILGFFLGREFVDKLSIGKKELLAWLFFILLGSSQYGNMFNLPFGPNFYCFILNLKPVVFWGNFVVIIFLARVSVLTNVQLFLSKYKVIQFISNLSWSRRFGLCYIIQVLSLVSLFFIRNVFYNPVYLDLVFFGILFMPELVFFSLNKILRKKN
ncbi:MAG: hypothetical protein HAW60_05165 [Bdellovibrionales bacterium]|nr:hypothetical protein [Bdellovibrionales bacterium]